MTAVEIRTGQATEAQRKQALAGEVASQVGGGWNVQSQTDYQAVLVKHGGKVTHWFHALMTIVTVGLWSVVWITAVVLKRREHHKVLSVDVYGNVTTRRR